MSFDVSNFGIKSASPPNGWKIRRIDEVAILNPDQINRDYSIEYIRYLDISNVSDGDIGKPELIQLKNAPSRAKRLVRSGDIILSTVRPGNRAYYYFRDPAKELVVSTGFTVVRALQCDSRFLYYVITSEPIINYLASIADEKSAYPSVNPNDIGECRIPMPPLGEQCNIGYTLGILDDKIELNRRMNATLEKIAQALYKSWFVDFDPVRAKAEGQQPDGIDEEMAGLFPCDFEIVDGREVPTGWKVSLLPEVFDINPKRAIKKGQIAPYLDMQNVPLRGHRPIDWIDRAFGSGTKFINGDTLLARITPCLENGKTIFVDFLNEGQIGWGSTEYIVLRPKPLLPVEYGYFLARDPEFRNYAVLNMTGSSGRQRVPVECFDTYKIVIPPKEIAMGFGKIAKNVMELIKHNDEQSRTLTSIREKILPKLLSGEIRVPPDDQSVEATA